MDELFQDVQTLTEEDTTAAECDGPLWHFEDLPERYALQYDARFARRFLVTVIAMTTRVVRDLLHAPGRSYGSNTLPYGLPALSSAYRST